MTDTTTSRPSTPQTLISTSPTTAASKDDVAASRSALSGLAPLVVIIILSFSSIGAPLPVISLYVHNELGFDAFTVGLVIGLQSVVTVLTRHWAGTIADRHGPKAAALAGVPLLIVYTAFFITFLATMTGAMAVDNEKIRAAQCLGARNIQVFWHVVVPATVPAAITGIRMALGNAFMTVIAAEFVAANSGIGYLIFSSRLFAQTDYVFAGILTLGVMGFVANAALRRVLSRIAYRYSVQY